TIDERGELGPSRFGVDLTAALRRARITPLAVHAHDLRHELDGEALTALVARGSSARLAAHVLGVAILRAEKRETTVPLLHLVAELHLESFATHRAALVHSRHRSSPVR